MADIYTPPPRTSYLLFEPFYMPTPRGDVWAIAFSNRSGSLVTAALSVIITLIFVALWHITAVFALMFGSETTQRRKAAMVAIWNLRDALLALEFLAQFIIQSFHSRPPGRGLQKRPSDPVSKTASPANDPEDQPTQAKGPPVAAAEPRDPTLSHPSRSPDILYGITFFSAALIVWGGSIAMGIVGPALINIGNSAPVRPSEAFYPATPDGSPSQALERFGLMAPASLRALGSVEAAEVTLRNRVNLVEDIYLGEVPNGNFTDRIYRLSYSYALTGTELGLRYATDLSLVVNGSCITEYDWIVGDRVHPPNSSIDVYQLWGLENQSFSISLRDRDIRYAPRASFQTHPNAARQFEKDSNISFAVIVSSAHRASISSGDDPWYATETRPADIPQAPYRAAFWMRRLRPVLSCWQQDKWHYGSHPLSSIRDIENVPGIKLGKAIMRVLETAFTVPMLIELGNASGDSALRSRTTSPNGVIDARASTIRDDLERLLLASYVGSRNTFTNAAMFDRDSTYRNLFRSGTDEPEEGAGDFVVSTPGITTFSLAGLIVLPATLVFLVLFRVLLGLLIQREYRNAQAQDRSSERWKRFKLFKAVRLLRATYELGTGESDESVWPCNQSFPYGTEDDDWGLIKCGQQSCKGHIKKTGERPI